MPEEGKINDAKALPLVLNLLARAVDYPGHLVHLNEVQILQWRELSGQESDEPSKTTYLCCELITNEEAIFDLNGPDHILRQIHHHLRVLHLLGLQHGLLLPLLHLGMLDGQLSLMLDAVVRVRCSPCVRRKLGFLWIRRCTTLTEKGAHTNEAKVGKDKEKYRMVSMPEIVCIK